MIIKRCVRSLLLLAFVLLVTPQSAFASTIILIDTTAKSFLPSLIAESRQLGGALPDGEQVTVYRLGQGWQPAFDHELSASSRITLGQVLSSTYAVKGQPDWVAALTLSTTVAHGSGTPRVFVFAPDLSATSKKGQYRGMTLLELLRDQKLAPTDVQFFVRFIREETGTVKRENVRLLTENPKWSELLLSRTTTTPTAKQPPSNGTERTPKRSWVWLILSVIAIPFVVFAVVWISRLRRHATEEEDFGRMSRAIDTAENGGRHGDIVHVVERLGGVNKNKTVVKEGEEVFVGDYYKARPSFAADGCYISLVQNNGVLEVENPSRQSARIGGLELSPGRHHKVPLTYVEMRIGKEQLSVTRQTSTDHDPLLEKGSEKLEVLNHDRQFV